MRRLSLNISLRSVIALIACGVLLPVMLATAAGIVALAIADDASDIVTAILMICFAAAAAGSGLIAVMLASRKAREARQQADFLAAVSHELRTPLATIRLYTQTLQSEKLGSHSADQHACLETIIKEAERLDSLVERVLTWRRASHNVLHLEIASHPISETVQQAVKRFEQSDFTREQSVDLTIETSATPPHDPDAIETSIINLLENAAKYAPEKTTIHVHCYETTDQACVAIRDEGCGLTSSQKKQIFRPFVQTSRRRNSRAGVGLGLSIAKYLIERHKGSITVTSSLGKGSSFTIAIPTQQNKNTPAPAPADSSWPQQDNE
jgi:two-component system phosphate regulon sensor histidine kinase PhoR